jgi:hypothetical protein
MTARELNGVRIGQPVRNLDGKDLGHVEALYDEAFLAVKGFPILFRRDSVIRYDEVRGERDGALVVARSDSELLELAAGRLPATWRVPVPPGFPSAATPGEARGVFAEVALGHAASGARSESAFEDLGAAQGDDEGERAPRRAAEPELNARSPGA